MRGVRKRSLLDGPLSKHRMMSAKYTKLHAVWLTPISVYASISDVHLRLKKEFGMQETIDFDNESDEPVEHQLRRDSLKQAVMYTADWTVETAISQLRQENIFLQPTFQRRDAWRISRKSRLVESILLGLPIPQIVLAERKDERGKFIVLDGKQRLLTLLQFVGGAIGSGNNNFALRDMEVLRELNGLKFDALTPDVKREFMNYAIRSSIIRNWPNSEFLEIVFVRLNEGSVRLSPQELRQGISPGPFTSYLEEASANSSGLKSLLKLEEPDFRMRDAELLLRLIAFSLFPDKYKGNMKAFLDEATIALNADWSQKSQEVEALKEQIEEAIGFGMNAFGPDGFGHKWVGSRYERPLNRAVTEVQIAGLLDPQVRMSLTGRESELVDAFKSVSADVNFNRAVEVTTKSLAATRDRFTMWGDAMAHVTNGLAKFPAIG